MALQPRRSTKRFLCPARASPCATPSRRQHGRIHRNVEHDRRARRVRRAARRATLSLPARRTPAAATRRPMPRTTPAHPTAAQLAAGDSCTLAFGDEAGKTATVPISFAPAPTPLRPEAVGSPRRRPPRQQHPSSQHRAVADGDNGRPEDRSQQRQPGLHRPRHRPLHRRRRRPVDGPARCRPPRPLRRSEFARARHAATPTE